MQLPQIVHLDADAFFVSVEQALHPELKGKKVAVGGRQRGIISSASYEARACGVYTPMPTSRALSVCPDLIVVSHTAGLYGQYSKRLFDLCEKVTPQVERNSIDEGYLDLEPCRLKTLAEIEKTIRRLQTSIKEELDITVSFGIAGNKLVSGIASKLKKPRGFVVVPVGEEARFLAPLSIGKLPGVGAKTEAALKAHGILLVSDLFKRSDAELESYFGTGWREMLARASGSDTRAVQPEEEDAKSYSQQETFSSDISAFSEVERIAKRMLDELMRKARNDGQRVRTLTLKIRYPNFEQTSASRSLREASVLELPFYPLIPSLLKQAWQRPQPLRLVSIKLSGLDQAPEQLELFGEGNEKRKRLTAAVDALKAKRGEDVVLKAAQMTQGPAGKGSNPVRKMEGFQRPGM